MSSAAVTVAHVSEYLRQIAPLQLAEEWDNVGLLLGDPAASARRLMTCLTLSRATVAEAVREQVDLVVVHHPLPFKPVKRITTETYAGRLLLELLRAGIHVYSAHTAWDSASDGINEHLAQRLELIDIGPLVPSKIGVGGVGRQGRLRSSLSLREVATFVKRSLGVSYVQVVGPLERPCARIGIGCGSAGSLLDIARAQGCDVFLTGEANLHTCYEAEGGDLGLILAGHYATERFHMEYLATQLATKFPANTVWCSREERTPEVLV